MLRHESRAGHADPLDPNIRADVVADPDDYRARFRLLVACRASCETLGGGPRWLTGASRTRTTSSAAARCVARRGTSRSGLDQGRRGHVVDHVCRRRCRQSPLADEGRRHGRCRRHRARAPSSAWLVWNRVEDVWQCCLGRLSRHVGVRGGRTAAVPVSRSESGAPDGGRASQKDVKPTSHPSRLSVPPRLRNRPASGLTLKRVCHMPSGAVCEVM